MWRPTASAVCCVASLLLAVGAPVYGIPAMHDAWRVAVALPLGAVAFVGIGVLRGSLLPRPGPPRPSDC